MRTVGHGFKDVRAQPFTEFNALFLILISVRPLRTIFSSFIYTPLTFVRADSVPD